jgi:hypothetical protein
MTIPIKSGKNMKTNISLAGTANPNTPAGRFRTACVARLLPLLLLLPAALQAQDYTFTTNDDNTITITGYTGSGGAVTIPSTINGLPVTSIGNTAFYYCTNLTSITIPNSVTSIGDFAFCNCDGLISLTIGNSVTSLGFCAFYYCTSLTNVTIPYSVTSIGDHAFGGCTCPITVTIPNSVTSIADSKFDGWTCLTSVTIPNSVTNIGDFAFYNCTSLTNVTIGDSVISIANDAFYNCIKLKAITVEGFNPVYSSEDGILFNQSTNTLIQCPEGKTGSYTILNSVTNIGDYAFDSCSGLTNVMIGNGVTGIGYLAFSGCASLMAITVDAANLVYSSVDGVLFDKSQTTLIQCPGGAAGNYTVPSSVTSIGTNAFTSCTYLTNVTIPNSVTSIERRAFTACTGLTSVMIGNGVTSLGEYVFASCRRLSSITIPNSVTNIGNFAFISCYSLTNATIGNSVTSIGAGAFHVCINLTSVMIPNSVISIGESAFDSCISLTNATIGNSVTSIGNNAFFYCMKLTSVTIGNGVTNIGDGAFSYCQSLSGVYFKGNAPGIGWFVFYDDFYDVTAYYLPGTTGWDAFSANAWIPTAPWYLPNPVILNSPSLGVQTNGFGFIISWATNISIVVEACTNFASPVWQPVQTNTLTDGWCYFSDPDWTNYPVRFYRLRSP